MAAVSLIILASCASLQREPTAEELSAKRFEAVPGQAVVYLFRPEPDFIDDGATVELDDRIIGTTYPGTFFRLVVAPGRHRLSGFAGDSGLLDFMLDANRIYFIEQQVIRFMGPDRSIFRPVAPGYGRAAVMQSELIPFAPSTGHAAQNRTSASAAAPSRCRMHIDAAGIACGG